MPTLLSARSRPTRVVGVGGGEGDDGGAGPGNRAFYGIAACAVALLLFCALAASVSVWMAFAFGGLALVAFAVAGCLAPAGWCVGPSADAESEAAAAAVDAAGAARARRRFGMAKAAIDALPTFAFTPKGADQGGDGGDLESGAAGREQCPVCLEDVEAGEMVRQLPACKHLFHVGCIDMWLQSHRTCPLCRCNLLRSQRQVTAVKAAPPAAAAAAEEEPPAEGALPPV